MLSDLAGRTPVPKQWSDQKRRGVIVVMTALSLVLVFTFVAFSTDTGYLSLIKTRMQNACDAASLAAAMEISASLENSGTGAGSNQIAAGQSAARLKAAEVALLNGVYVDPTRDVTFGRRTLNASSGKYSIEWNASSSNVVKVTARRDGNDVTKPDAKLNLFFSKVFSDGKASLVTEAAAYIESRDIVCSLDYSGSMNDDSCYTGLGRFDRTKLDTNMDEIFSILKAQRNLGLLTAIPEWHTQTVSTSGVTGSVTFRNNYVDVTTSKPMTTVNLTYSDGTTDVKTGSGTSGTFSRSGTLKAITGVSFELMNNYYGTTQSSTKSSGSRTATVTFSGANATVVTNSSMSSVRFTYEDGSTQTFSTSGTNRTFTGNGDYISSVRVTMSTTTITITNPNGSSSPGSRPTLSFNDTTTNIKAFLGVSNVAWPWASGSWDDFINHCRTSSYINSAGYLKKYGGRCLVNYLLQNKPAYTQCNDLWRTPHYPYHSVKQGALMFTDLLDELKFGDQLGFVAYATTSVKETGLNYDGYNITMTTDPINDRYADLKAIISHRQAGHYNSTTNIGAGIKEAKLLLDNYARPGARQTMVVMTDGMANEHDGTVTLPADWSWSELFDYDGNGTGDYTTSDINAQYALIQAKAAIDAGYTIHTMTVGADADPNLMRAIAWMGKGYFINVPGGRTTSEMQEDVIAAFSKIAAFVPPPKLVNPEEL